MSENNYGALMMKSAIGASDDINAIFQPGIYIIPPSNTSSPDATGGVLTVHSGTPIRRTFTSDSVICLTSTRNGSTWSLWKGPLSRINPFADIKADGAAAVAAALSNLGLGEAAKMPAAELVVNRNTLSAKIPVLAGSVRMNLIIQASQVTSSTASGTIIFPSAFPNACVMILSHDFSIAASDLSNVRFNIPGKSSVSWLSQLMNTGGEVSPATWGWLAIGW